MALAEANKNYFNFSGGFVSDASPLVFPPNTSVDEVNFPLRLDGARHRRKGLDFESSYVKASQTLASTDAIRAYDWHNVGNDADVNFQVVQTGSTLHFYSKDSDSYSNNKKSFTTDLTTRKVSGTSDATVAASPIQGAAGKGYFFVVGQYIEPFYITYDSGGDSISLTAITITARDFKGTEETVGISDRPSSLTVAHTYDLYNQGWDSTKISTFYSAVGSYPSNADRYEYGTYADVSTGLDTFSATQLAQQTLGNTPAARGHFIWSSIFDTTLSTGESAIFTVDTYSYSAGTVTLNTVEDHGLSTSDVVTITNNSFEFDNGGGCAGSEVADSFNGSHTITVTGAKQFTFSQTLTGWTAWCTQYISKGFVLGDTIANPNGETISNRPEVVSFYAGRAWYAGINSSSIGSNIYFSQIALADNALGKCYQVADPTSTEVSELVETDGGVIPIPEIGQLLSMVPLGTSLVLFADNGIWSIEPGETGYFTATSYSIRKITNVGCVSERSVVQAEGAIFFWSSSGIYILKQDDISGFVTAQNISINKIETHLKTIPDANKEAVKGEYNSLNREIQWVYNTTSSDPQVFNKELVFNISLNAWSKNSFNTTVGPEVIELVHTLNKTDQENKIKYLTNADNTHITFSNYNNTDFLDWETHDTTGADAAGYIISSYELLEDAMRGKFANRVFCYFNRTEDTATADGSGDLNLSPKSGCMLQTRWDWAGSSTANKWSTEKEVYRFRRYYPPTAGAFDNGHPVVVTNNKVRGRGKVVSFKFSTEAGKDCQLLGWAVNYLGVTKP